MQNSPLVAYIQFLLQCIVDARRLLLSPNDANLAVRSAMRCGRVMGSGNFPGRRDPPRGCRREIRSADRMADLKAASGRSTRNFRSNG